MIRRCIIALCLVSMVGSAKADEATVPPSYFGLHATDPDNWPTVPFGTVRPSNVSWRVVNPAPGRYDWSRLDRWVTAAEQHKVELSYLFLATPQWASSHPTEACYAGAIGCAAPPADMKFWRDYVTAVVKRYRGRIQSYEIWNEPNDTHYWTGSVEAMVDMAANAYEIIKSIDPKATVISPSPTYVRLGPPHVWLNQFLEAGGGKYADVIGFHGYTSSRPEAIAEVVNRIREVVATHHQEHKELWNTEAGWGKDSALSDPEAQAAFLAKYYILQAGLGVRRFLWYQWDNPNWGTLWERDSGVRPAGKAFAQVYGWLVGASVPAHCNEEQDAIWTCTLSHLGKTERITWSSGPPRTRSAAPFTKLNSLSGDSTALKRGEVTIGKEPVLLQ